MPDCVDAQQDAQTLLAYCRQELLAPDRWRRPTGYPNSLALCVLDAVWSLGANYDLHVTPILKRYRDYRRGEGHDPETDGASDLLGVYQRLGGPTGFRQAVGNNQRAYPRSHAPFKADTVHQAAEALHSQGINTAAQLRDAVASAHGDLKRAWRAVPGLHSSLTGWRYLLLLAGIEQVKPDRMILRFVAKALDVPAARLSEDRAATLLAAVADAWPVSVRLLDHSIWRYESGRTVSDAQESNKSAGYPRQMLSQGSGAGSGQPRRG